MITNKDLSIDSKNGKITLNGNKYDLETKVEIEAALKDVYSVMGQMGAKNFIPRPYADGEEKSQNNMKYTVNTDGTITATATQALTNDATFYLYGPTNTEELVLKAGVTYVLSGDPGSTGVERIVVAGRSAAGGTSETLIINNTGVPKEYTPDVDKVITTIYIRNYADASVPIPYNETFKPMLRLAADTDDTYQPYAMTNKQLTEQVATKQNLPTAMATGKAQFPAAAICDQDIEVPFPAGLFNSAPVVTATMSDTTPFNVGTYMEADLYVYNVTKDSFFLRGKRKNANYAWFANWIAVEM